VPVAETGLRVAVRVTYAPRVDGFKFDASATEIFQLRAVTANELL